MEPLLAECCKLLPKPQRSDEKEESVLNQGSFRIQKIMKSEEAGRE